MLIQKPLSPGDIVSFKLNSGDEVVGKLVLQDGSSCTLAKPVVVALHPGEGGQVQFGFLPFMVSTGQDAPVSVPLSSMLTKPASTRTDVANNYRRATSSIETAPAAPGLLGL